MKRRWLLFVLVGWALVRAGSERVLNEGGWPSFARFWRAVGQPELAGDFLRLTLDASLSTAAYAVLGAATSVGLGVLVGPLVSERLWEFSGRRWLRSVLGAAAVGPRAVHEIIWALLLVQILGFDPLVAVLAIGAQFGAITAKVYAEMIDEADPGPWRAMRSAGASPVAALVYGLAPSVTATAASYAFYRLECAVRSAAVLGIIGAGGLGVQLDLSFESLRYDEIWTLIFALMILSGLTDWWSSRVRHSERGRGISLAVLVAALPLAAVQVGLDPRVLFEERTRRLAGRLLGDLVPPRLGPGGLGELVDATLDTAAMSVLATLIAALGGLALAIWAARAPDGGWGRRAIGWLVRLVLLLARAVPSPVWAFLMALVMFPGIWPGAVALGVYNMGVVGRLFAEVIEDHDQRARRHLANLGAPPLSQMAYAVLPAVAARLVALTCYRWEVITRETVVVGVVGTAGLGRLIQEHLVARDIAAVAGAIVALIVLAAAVDALSRTLRAALR